MKLPRSLRLLPLVLLALVPVARIAAQEGGEKAVATPVATDLPPARKVLDRFLEVTRAKEFVEKTTSMHVTGKFELSGGQMEGPIQIWFKKPNLQRSAIELPMIGKMVQGCDGKVSWMTNAMTGARLSSGVELLQARLEADYAARLKPDSIFESIETVGRKTFDGRDCYEVEEVLRAPEGMDAQETLEGRTVHAFYEVESGLLAGTELYTESDMFAGKVRTFYKEYGTYAGYPIAKRSVIETGPQVVTITVESVELDTVDDAVFSVPADVQALLDREAARRAAEPAAGKD